MAGTFTHWMVVLKAIERYDQKIPDQDKHRYFATLLERSDFVIMGAIGPDYPCATELAEALLKPAHRWADRMHFERTGEFVAHGIRNLEGLKPGDFEVCLAWLCGYATHLLADSIVHPVVNAIVGGLPEFTSSDHRHCEMTQDTWIYKEVTGNEIAYGQFVDRLRTCSFPPGSDLVHPAITSFWRKTLQDNHPGAAIRLAVARPEAWHASMLRLIGVVGDPPAVFRHIGEAAGVVYKRSSELSTDEIERFVKKVPLPGKGEGDFRRDVFDKVVEQVVKVWQRLFQDVEARNADGCRAYLKNWDLDRGVDLDAPSFWA